MTQEKTIIRINWSGPYVVEDISKPGAKNAKASFRKGRKTYPFNLHGEDIGVYQIYGNHLLYGKDVLLYIGMAPETSFATRIDAHMNNWVKEHWDGVTSVHVGKLDMRDGENPKNKTDAELIRAAEGLLIHYHSTAYNGSNIETLYYRDSASSRFVTENIVCVKNHRDRRCLQRTVPFTAQLR